MKKVQLFGNPEEFRAVVKCCLIAQTVGQLSKISGWFGLMEMRLLMSISHGLMRFWL